MPKSGEHEENTPPREALASISSQVSGMFGNQATTRSPGRMPTPAPSAPAMRPTSDRNSAQLNSRRSPASPLKISAGASSLPRSRFSAKFSRASGKNRPSYISAAGSKTRSPRSCAMTSQKSQAAAQNAAGSATEKSWRAV